MAKQHGQLMGFASKPAARETADRSAITEISRQFMVFRCVGAFNFTKASVNEVFSLGVTGSALSSENQLTVRVWYSRLRGSECGTGFDRITGRFDGAGSQFQFTHYLVALLADPR